MTLRLDSSGTEVLLLQYRLTMAGFPTSTTATFDSATHEAVAAFHRAKDLPTDGIVGPNTRHALTQALTPKAPSANMFMDAARTLGVVIPIIQAVAEVESNGKGFLLSGQPTILFERHVFYRRLAAHDLDPDLLATHLP